MSKYRVTRRRDHFVIANEHRGVAAGYIEPTYTVLDCHAEEIAVAASVDEAVAALAAHRAANPPRWEDGGRGRYIKTTQEYCDFLAVEQSQDGRWTAFRNDYELCDGDGPKTFRTAREAQRAADLHADDEHPNAKRPKDGLRWSCTSDPQEELEDRLHAECRLGETVTDAAEAISRARTEYTSGGIRPETQQALRVEIERLRAIWEASRFGSYDMERGSRDPYFIVIEGGAESRISFEEAAYHYGALALHKHLGPDVSDTVIRQMIADVLKRLPAADRLPQAA